MLGSVEWLKNEKGVSPIIGVILMVAITVIMAATIASFVFGMGSKLSIAAPNAQLVVKDAADEVGAGARMDIFYIDHIGGDTLACNELRILVYYKQTGELVAAFNYDETRHRFYYGDIANPKYYADGADTNDLFEPGERLTFREWASQWGAGTYTVKILHIPSGQIIYAADIVVR